MKKVLMLLLMTLLLFFAPQQSVRSEEAGRAGYDTQTIMVYIVGSDLESEGGLAVSDISEMLKARVTFEVADRMPGFTIMERQRLRIAKRYLYAALDSSGVCL